MTPKLIALVLAQSLPVRLALLDADPTGPGWAIDRYGYGAHVHETPLGLLEGDTTPYERIERGAAWLPCNPLAIAEHAGTFQLPEGTSNVRAGVANDGLDGKYAAWVIYYDPTGAKISDRDSGAHDDAHTAAVRLLAEVVGG